MRRYTVFLGSLAAALFLGSAAAQEDASLKKLKTTATSLDELIHEEGSGKSRWNTYTLKPIKISSISPLIAERLKIDEAEVKQLLESKTEKLSRIALARMISDKSGQSWRDLLLAHKNDALIEELQKQSISLEQAHTTLENLYVDISFASFDPVTGPTGKPAGSSKGRKAAQ